MASGKCRNLAFPFCLLCLIALGSDTFCGSSRVASLAHKGKGNCTYTVTLETTCVAGAETSNHVSLRFGDVKSNDVVVRDLNTKHVTQVDPLDPAGQDDPPAKPFRSCSVDEFHVEGPCVETRICYAYLKLTGSDDWRPGFVRVRVSERAHLDSGYFYIRRFLPRNVWHGFDTCDREVTPFGTRHKRKVLG